MPCVKAGPHTRNGKEIRRMILIMDFYDLISAVGICLGGDTEDKVSAVMLADEYTDEMGDDA